MSKRRHEGQFYGHAQGAHITYTEAQTLEEACDVLLSKKRRMGKTRKGARDRHINSALGRSLTENAKPVTLPKITLPEINWED